MITNKTAISAIVLLFCLVLPLVAEAATAKEIDAGADATLKSFSATIAGGQELLDKAKGVLVFPTVYQAGVGIGGEYGRGSLRISGKTVDYYSIAGGSIGVQLGAQKKSIVMLFMQQAALDKFRASKGWQAGVDGSVVMAKKGAEKQMDTVSSNAIVAYVLDQEGAMFDASLDGTKFTKLDMGK